jgi:hypothetical protein
MAEGVERSGCQFSDFTFYDRLNVNPFDPCVNRR